MEDPVLRQYLNTRLESLRSGRYSWWISWAELAEYILPYRYTWLVTQNQYNRGQPKIGRILDSTATIAARNCANGMMSGITSPTRPWFKLRLDTLTEDQNNPINIWLEECERRMMRVFGESNFYSAMATLYLDVVVFGTGTMVIYEDFNDVIRCYNPCAGEYFVAMDDRLQNRYFYREFIYTLSQIEERWPGVLPESERKLVAQGNGRQERKIGHAIEPDKSGRFAYREVYWDIGAPNNQIYSKRIFHEQPHVAPRWDVFGNDAYGRGPASDAIGDVKQLQQETRRKAQALDKMVNPPMVGDLQLQNQPASTLPGGVTYVSSTSQAGFRAAYQINFPVQEITADIMSIQDRIRTIFFNDLFLMISQLTTVRSATEIDARREEKLVMLGPVLERLENEALDPIIDRVFGIMMRGGLLPEPPPEIAGMDIQVQYVSMLAEAQRATATAGIERLLSLAGNMAAVAPGVLDKIDFDQSIDQYNEYLRNSPRIVRSDEQVAEIRKNRETQQAQAQQAQQTMEGVKAAETLSKTEVGGGNNALQQILGNF